MTVSRVDRPSFTRVGITMVQGATVLSDTFSVFHTILNANVQQITDATGSTITLRTSNGNYWTGAFPDIDIEDRSEYPIGVISTPTMDEDITGFNFRTNNLEVELAAFGTRAEHPPMIIEKAWQALKDNCDDLQNEGFYSIQTGISTTDVFMKNGTKIHEHRLPIEITLGGC